MPIRPENRARYPKRDLHTYGLQLLVLAADRLDQGIMTGHDHSNSDDELARLQGARLLRECSAEIKELRGDRETLAWWMAEALGALCEVGADAEDGGESLRMLRDRGERLVIAILDKRTAYSTRKAAARKMELF